MWICEFKILSKDNKIVELISECNLTAFYYPVNYYEQKGRYYFIAVGILKGEENYKRRFFSEIKKLKKVNKGRRVELLETENDFFLIISSHSKDEETEKFVKIFYNPSIIHVKPVFVSKDDWEEWEIASLERKNIEKIIKIGEKIYELELLKFHQKKIKNFGFITLLPELTEKQERALRLALEHGYYKYPRKTSLDKLSKIAKLSFSTFQAHVKKAENKIISYVVNLKK